MLGSILKKNALKAPLSKVSPVHVINLLISPSTCVIIHPFEAFIKRPLVCPEGVCGCSGGGEADSVDRVGRDVV